MANKQLTGLMEGLKKGQGRTIISAVGPAKKTGADAEKVHAHFYLSASVIDRMREFQVKNRKEFPRISHVIEEAVKQFLKQK
ncbi:MAG: hypothetical protein NTY10_00345 [Candidatus Omnitrophica bacterium]|nr:hypothetical protein [Candidatus Omnitrophota bacterium]